MSNSSSPVAYPAMSAVGCLLLLAITFQGHVFAGQVDAPSMAPRQQIAFGRLLERFPPSLRVSVHPLTGRLTFLGFDLLQALPMEDAAAGPLSPVETARRFLSSHGVLFGLSDPSNDLVPIRSREADNGRCFVRFQQVYAGIPILGGELIVQVDRAGRVISAGGEVLPAVKVGSRPEKTPEEAVQTALSMLETAYGFDAVSPEIDGPELFVFNPILLGHRNGATRLVWRIEIYETGLHPINEFILVDAITGEVVLEFSQIMTAKTRRVYDHANSFGRPLPGDPFELRRTEGQGPSGISDVDSAYAFTGDTYDFYASYHGRDSIDAGGMELISTVRNCTLGCPMSNAFWNGSQMVFGEGFAVDDVVAHELTHGVTADESGLMYMYESGAINESFSDIWGEFVDLTNGKGNDDPGVRWLLGEDLPIGAARSLADPPAYNDPDRMGSEFYYCGSSDNGGVHINSGVGNKAAFLLTDGGSFNNVTLTGLGIEKTADLFYEVQSNLLTSMSSYLDLANALVQAAVDLGFSDADRAEVGKAITATQMKQLPCQATPDNDDNYEPNSRMVDATDLSQWHDIWLSEIDGLGIQADDDWYRVDMPSMDMQTLAVRCTFSHAEGDINVMLYDVQGWPLMASYSQTNEEFFAIDVEPGTYYILVFSADQGNAYDLRWNATGPSILEPNSLRMHRTSPDQARLTWHTMDSVTDLRTDLPGRFNLHFVTDDVFSPQGKKGSISSLHLEAPDFAVYQTLSYDHRDDPPLEDGQVLYLEVFKRDSTTGASIPDE